jgi:hypothetical protein
LLNDTVEPTASVAAAATPIAVAAVGPNSAALMSKAVGVFLTPLAAIFELLADGKNELMLVMVHSTD